MVRGFSLPILTVLQLVSKVSGMRPTLENTVYLGVRPLPDRYHVAVVPQLGGAVHHAPAGGTA